MTPLQMICIYTVVIAGAISLIAGVTLVSWIVLRSTLCALVVSAVQGAIKPLLHPPQAPVKSCNHLLQGPIRTILKDNEVVSILKCQVCDQEFSAILHP